MIELIPKPDKNMGAPSMIKYFLFTEADKEEEKDKEEENTDDVKAEVTPIKIDGRRGGMGKRPPDQQPPEPAPEEEPAPEADAPDEATPEPVGADDIAADDDDDMPPPPDEAPDDTPADEPAPQNDQEDAPPADNAGDAPDDTGENQDSADTAGGDGEKAEVDEISVGGGGDDADLPPSPDSAPEGENQEGEQAPDDAGGDQSPEGEEDEGEEEEADWSSLDDENTETATGASGATRKYNLYRDYLSLYTSVKSYIERLERSRPDSLEANIVINSALDKLRKVCASMAEYMTVRFEEAGYVQSMMFYQQLIATIRLCFSLIRNNKPFLDQTAHIEDLDKPNRKSGNKH